MNQEEIKKEYIEQFTDGCDEQNDYYDSQFEGNATPNRVFDFFMSKQSTLLSSILSEVEGLPVESEIVNLDGTNDMGINRNKVASLIKARMK